MNRLPAVLQKEIWEYVRGDRAFWKQKFELVMEELFGHLNCRSRRRRRRPRNRRQRRS